jgi:RNA polymerase sigma-70 factor (ECF subfamily)
MEDSRIIELYEKRSEVAIRETDSTYGRYCRTIARSILGNDADTEECVNDTYLKVWNAIPPERPMRLDHYLGRIVRNLALDRRKSQQRAKRGGGQYPLVLEELSETLAGGESAEERYEAGRLTEALNRFLEQLPKEKRILFLARYWYFKSIEEIARQFGLSQSKVKMTLLRTRNELKEYLQKEDIEV